MSDIKKALVDLVRGHISGENRIFQYQVYCKGSSSDNLLVVRTQEYILMYRDNILDLSRVLKDAFIDDNDDFSSYAEYLTIPSLPHYGFNKKDYLALCFDDNVVIEPGQLSVVKN